LTVGRHFEAYSEIGDNQQECEVVKTEVEGPMALETITRQPMKTQQTEKTQYKLK
jgi:hypothetical protein